MKYPENPNSILVKNNFYPKGLIEEQIWNHYTKNKNKIIKYISGRKTMLFIAYDVNKLAIRRKLDNNFFTIDKQTFDKIMHPRVLSLAVESEKYINTAIIDIDSNLRVNDMDKIEFIKNMLSKLQTRFYYKDHKIFVSSTSFHVHIILPKKYDIDIIRENVQRDLLKFYENSKLSNKKIIIPRYPGIDVDLSTLYFRSSHTVPNSLNRNGIICADVTRKLRTFNRRNYIV